MFVYYKCYYYDRIDVFDRINFNRTSASKEYHYWYFLNYSFKFQTNICNRCHDLLMSINLIDVDILNIKGCDYCCIILISKNEVNELIAKCWFDWKK